MSDKLEQDNIPWYAIRLFSIRQKEVGDVLDKENRVSHVLKPVVTNLIFVKKTMTQKEMKAIVAESNLKMSVIRKERESLDYYEIPAKQMFDFRVMCNPEIMMRKYLTEEEAKLKSGAPVLVKYGPLKGLTGKLVRSSKKYFLLKEVPGMAVMLKVSRWCCVPIEE